jgi:transcriptional regulatory protein GAL4
MTPLDVLHPIVHEPTIRAQLTGALPLPSGAGAHVLLNMIFATGAFDAAVDDTVTNSDHYYKIARSHLQRELLAEGSLTLVQGLAVMAIYLQRANKPNAGYVCLGLALRMGMALGLHDDPPDGGHTGLSVLDLELRNRVWWCLVTLETGMSATYGRPHGISLALLSTVRLPINTEDECLTVSTKSRPPNALYATRYTALVKQALLARMLISRLDRVSRSFPSPTVEQVKWAGDQFRTELENLPPFMNPIGQPAYQFALAVQSWRARDYCSVLYRPVFLSAVWSVGSTAASDGCVREIIE